MSDTNTADPNRGDTNRGGGTRREIQRVALELFTTKGFEKTSLREIAERLGVTKAALYYHYPSKSELIRSIVEPVIDDVDRLIDKAESAELVDARAFFEEAFDTFHHHGEVFEALIRDASAFAHIDLETRSIRWANEIPDVLAGKDASSEQRVYAWVAFTGLVRASLMELHVAVPADVLRRAAIDSACAALNPGEHLRPSSG